MNISVNVIEVEAVKALGPYPTEETVKFAMPRSFYQATVEYNGSRLVVRSNWFLKESEDSRATALLAAWTLANARLTIRVSEPFTKLESLA